MLQSILNTINSSKTALSVSELSQKLDIEENALEGMIMQLVRMGKLKINDYADLGACPISSCSKHECSSCGQSRFLIKTYSVIKSQKV